ncbi:MAG: 50S ribosomal protein L23 [Chloroflexi bacterium RBG_13_54_9]|nr:MAG: 50S ribosomal protein L23 [Chloroflexi bacterium RBG_13_54_9]
MHPYDVLRRPLITEKGTNLQGQNKYIFEVARDANKMQIKEAVEKVFNVKVMAVNVSNVPGKMKRLGRHSGMTRSWKKAVVTLAEGQTIEFFEGV